MHLFRSVTPQLARDAFHASATETTERSLKDTRDAIQSSLRRMRIAFEGGEAVIEELIMREAERPKEMKLRRAHYRDVPVTSTVIRTLAHLLYGQPPKIDVWIGERPPTTQAQLLALSKNEQLATDEASEEYSAWMQETLDANQNNALMLRAARMRLRDNRCAVKVWGVDAEGTGGALPFDRLRMDVHKAEDAIPIYDPEDPDVLLAVAEYRRDKWLLWTADEINLVDDKMESMVEAGLHPLPGTIPFAFLSGDPILGWMPDYQKNLINKQSTISAVERAYAFPVYTSSGKLLNSDTTLPDGSKGVDMGGKRILFYEDPAGGLTAVSVDANVNDMRETYQAELREALNLGGGLPDDIGASGGATPEQPTTVALRWIKSFINRDMLVLEAQAFEGARQHILAAYGAEYSKDFGLKQFDASAVDWSVKFPKNPLPHDQREERELAMREVQAGVRLLADVVADNYPDADAEELQEIMEALKDQKKTEFPSFGFEQPPEVESEEPPEIG